MNTGRAVGPLAQCARSAAGGDVSRRRSPPHVTSDAVLSEVRAADAAAQRIERILIGARSE